MIFSELYSAYYNAVADILRTAIDHPLKKDELQRIITEHAFAESILNIEPALSGERWQLLKKDGETPLKYPPSMPLTTLQKRWLKAIALDPRIKLFGENLFDFPEVSPLFTAQDVRVFDQYADGDPYDDPSYIDHFRLILSAVKRHVPLRLDAANRRGSSVHMIVMPEYLEYSEKDDKFRLITSGCRYGGVINLGRITSCSEFQGTYRRSERKKRKRDAAGLCHVTFEVVDERKALERVLMHFAHFEKQAERIEGKRYRVSLLYDGPDETEMVIRLLSFGPMVKVTEPESFVELIKDRLRRQKSCGQ